MPPSRCRRIDSGSDLPSQGLARRNSVPGAVFRGEAAHVGEAVAVGDLGDGVERRVGLTQLLVDTGEAEVPQAGPDRMPNFRWEGYPPFVPDRVL